MRDKGKEAPEPESDEAFLQRLEHEQFRWYSSDWMVGRRPEEDDSQPAGISRGDHKRVVQLARHMIHVRRAHKDAG